MIRVSLGPQLAGAPCDHQRACGVVQIMDLMGYEPCHENKINIHVGG
jgi:hypothetical protein